MTDALTRCCEELICVGEKLRAVTAERDEAVEALRWARDHIDCRPTNNKELREEDDRIAKIDAILAKHAKGE